MSDTPYCTGCGYHAALLADRIEELEAKLRESALQELSALGQASDAYRAQLAAEAKLEEAAERVYKKCYSKGHYDLAQACKDTVLYLKGETDGTV